MVLTFLKNISQWEGLSHILWKNKTCSKPPTSIRSSQFHVFPHTNPTTTSWTSELATGGGGAVSKHGNSPCTDLVSGLSHHFNGENDDETLWKVPLSDPKAINNHCLFISLFADELEFQYKLAWGCFWDPALLGTRNWIQHLRNTCISTCSNAGWWLQPLKNILYVRYWGSSSHICSWIEYGCLMLFKKNNTNQATNLNIVDSIAFYCHFLHMVKPCQTTNQTILELKKTGPITQFG